MDDFTMLELCRLWVITADGINESWCFDIQNKIHDLIDSRSKRELSEEEIREIAREKT